MWLDEPHRRHLLLTFLVGAGLASYLVEGVRTIRGLDLAVLLAVVGGLPIWGAAIRGLLARRLSASLAVALAAVGALAIGEAAVAAEVVFIMLIGEALEHFAVDRTRSGVASLLALRPQTARVRRDGDVSTIRALEIREGDTVLLGPGDRVPVDGRVEAGSSSIDQSPITGEPMPVDRGVGDEVLSGTLNLHGKIEVRAERVGAYTTLERVIHLVEHAEATRAPSVRLADRFAGWFVPAVLVAAGATWLATGETVRAVAVLVVACPCALVLATPAAVAAGIGGLARSGVLVKGGAVLERIGRVETVVFDKTGTLTRAEPRLAEVIVPAGESRTEILHVARSVETSSEHPIGRLIVEAASAEGVPAVELETFRARVGTGAEGCRDGETWRVGNVRMLEEAGVSMPPALLESARSAADSGRTVVLVARGRRAIGALALEDTLRPEAADVVAHLRRELGIRQLVVLSGDHPGAVRAVADRLGIRDARGGLLPEDKVRALRRLRDGSGPVLMVGDGINDAPSLAAADIGAALGGISSDVAIDSAGIILMRDDLGGLAVAIRRGRDTLRVIRQNVLLFAVLLNVAAVVGASLGQISPVAGAVIHQLGSLAVVLSALRLLARARPDPRRLTLSRRLRELGDRVRCHWRLATAIAGCVVAAAWTLSGTFVVGAGEVALVRTLGRARDVPEGPGLHWRPPWPFGVHDVLAPRALRRVEVGFRTLEGEGEEPAAYEWHLQHRSGRAVRQAEEATLLAGDETLVDVQVVALYRLCDPVAAVLRVGPPAGREGGWDSLIRRSLEAAVRSELSRRGAGEVLGPGRAEIEASVLERLGQQLASLGCGLEPVAVALGDVHPPVEVVSSFRDVSGAREEKEARIEEANAYRAEVSAIARGSAVEARCRAEAWSLAATRDARAAAQRFLALLGAWRGGRDVTTVRWWLRALEAALSGRRLVIVDADARSGPRGIWIGWERGPSGGPVRIPDGPEPVGEVESPPADSGPEWAPVDRGAPERAATAAGGAP